MLRYALPVLGLVLIGGAFFGLRQSNRKPSLSEYVAVKQGHATAPAAEAPRTGTDQPNERYDASLGKRSSQKDGGSKAVASAPEATPVPADSSAGKEEKQAGEGSSREAPKVAKGDADKAAKTEAKPGEAGQPATARTEPAPAPPAAKTAAVNQDQQKDVAAYNVADDRARGRDVNASRKGPARNENEVATQNQRGPAKGQVQSQSASKMKAAEDNAAGASRPGSNDEAETRTVSGRQFRRVGNAWVDTAYKSSMAIRSVTRGTEAYQALVADEPVIASIADRLSGEVIVVWKGRVYRIN
jgi:hypothetical protein